MARKTTTVTINDEGGRDHGKVYVITEMGAAQAEKWGCRALLALAHSGVELPDDAANMGLAGIARLGVQALGGLDWQMAEPLFDEMMSCIRIMPNPAQPGVVRDLVDDDIEDVKTRIYLRRCVLELHIEFFTDASLWKQARSAVAGGTGRSS